MILEIVLLVLLVFLSAVFSSTEIAMFSISELRIRHLIEQDVKHARLFKKLRDDSHKLLITILIGNNIVNIGAASIATALAIRMFGNIGVGIATGVMTVIILIAGEITPKAFATKNSQSISLFMTPIIGFLMKLSYPVVWVFDKLTLFIVPDGDLRRPLVTEEEVRDILKLSEEQGSIKRQEEVMIQNIFKLDDTTVEEIMRPRPDVFAIEAGQQISSIKQKVKESGYSRVPVFEGDLDNIKGILYAKDLISVQSDKIIDTLLRPVFFIPETKLIDSLLRDFKQKKIHIAVVVNEYGTMMGIVTIEDFLEEIVGEIFDETDGKEDMEKPIRSTGKNTYSLKGKADMKEIAELLGFELPKDAEYTSLSGFIMSELNRVPQQGDQLTRGGWIFEVSDIQNRRVEEVFVRKV